MRFGLIVTLNNMKRFITSVAILGVLIMPAAGGHLEAKALKTSFGAPTALCKDGTHSYSQTRRGTCSHHRGVSKWYR